MTTGERIRAARIAAGMTQAELADKVGVKFAAIHKYETGKIENFKRTTIAKLAVALDVRPAYLLGFTDDPSADVEIAETVEEIALLRLFRGMNDEQRKTLLSSAKLFVQK